MILEAASDTWMICRLPPDAAVPSWALQGAFSSITRTPEELSIVCRQSDISVEAGEMKMERGWRGLKVRGPLDFGLTGILASLTTPLAQAGISVFTISTFDTDYLLVKEGDLRQTSEALLRAGHEVMPRADFPEKKIETPADLTIRQARPEDTPFLAQAEREIAERPGFLVSRPHELLDDRFREKIIELTNSKFGRYLVAEKDGQLIGHGMLDPMALDAVRHVVQLTLAVHPGWQGKGVGAAILTALIDWAKEDSLVEKIELQVRSSNTLAQSLYRKLGFAEEGRRQRRIKLSEGQYLDDVLMGLWLKEKHRNQR